MLNVAIVKFSKCSKYNGRGLEARGESPGQMAAIHFAPLLSNLLLPSTTFHLHHHGQHLWNILPNVYETRKPEYQGGGSGGPLYTDDK